MGSSTRSPPTARGRGCTTCEQIRWRRCVTGQQRQVRLEEVSDRAAVVAGYYARESFSRPYMDVPENPSLDDFAARSAEFPVFRVTPAG